MAHSGHDWSATDRTGPHFYAHVVGTLAIRFGRQLAAPAALALLLLTLIPIGAGVATAANSTWSPNCDANIRSRPTTTSTKRTTIHARTLVTVSGKIAV